MTTPEEIARIAKGLSSAAKRDIQEKRPEWCCSWNAQGHQFLTSRGLVEHIAGNCGKLTPLGLAVRTYLMENPQ